MWREMGTFAQSCQVLVERVVEKTSETEKLEIVTNFHRFEEGQDFKVYLASFKTRPSLIKAYLMSMKCVEDFATMMVDLLTAAE